MVEIRQDLSEDLIEEIRKVAEEIQYKPGEVGEVARLARTLIDRGHRERTVVSDALSLEWYLAEHLPDLTLDCVRETIAENIREVATEIGFDGEDWTTLARVLSEKGILPPTLREWDAEGLRDFCEREVQDLVQHADRVDNPGGSADAGGTTDLGLELLQVQETDSGGRRVDSVPVGAVTDVEFLALEDFMDRLDDLLGRFVLSSDRENVPLREFFKWRMQAHWFLTQHLGADHIYTREFDTTVGEEPDPYSNSREIMAGQGILEALRDDFRKGHLRIKWLEKTEGHSSD